MCTHAHDDHINAAQELAKLTAAPVMLHPADTVLWQQFYPDWSFDHALSDDEVLGVAGIDVQRTRHRQASSVPGFATRNSPA